MSITQRAEADFCQGPAGNFLDEQQLHPIRYSVCSSILTASEAHCENIIAAARAW